MSEGSGGETGGVRASLEYADTQTSTSNTPGIRRALGASLSLHPAEMHPYAKGPALGKSDQTFQGVPCVPGPGLAASP